jgi:hypothetical protein
VFHIMVCKVPIELEVGRLRVRLDGIDLRYVEVDGVEVVRRAFVTIRDAEWATPELAELSVDVTESDGAIAIVGSARARLADLDATCEVRARVSESGLEYAVDWSPHAAFEYNRMGLCVLHPAESAGQAYRTSGPAGAGRLPTTIGPQLLVGGELQPLFEPFESLELEVAGLGPCRFAFTGERFEMEDQRNWSDGSFKTYCTPLSEPRPRRAQPGTPVRQAVRLELPPPPSTPRARRSDVVELACEHEPAGAIPRLGLCWRPGAPAAFGLHHVRVDVRDDETAADELAEAAAFARKAGCALIVAAHVPIGDAVAAHADVISHVLAFADVGELPAGVLRVGGTDEWFVELNRSRPEPGGLDGIAWSVTPQVHASDELTMVEGLAAQTDQLTTARAFAPGLPLLVGPITLRPGGAADPREGSAFAAAWTAGSIAAQAAGGAWGATYGGAVDAAPTAAVLADACRWQGWTRLRSTSSAPLAAQLLAVRGDEAIEGWVVNLRDAPTRTRVRGLGDGAIARALGAAAPAQPHAAGAAAPRPLGDGDVVELPPWGLLRLG